MTRTLIVGIDTVAGRSLAEQLSRRSEVRGLWFSKPEFLDGCPGARVSPKSLNQETASADVIVFCGGAAKSSWDADFGDFSHEQNWLNQCLNAIEHDQRFAYISSDAVFSGPWLFHDDTSTSLATNRLAKTILKYESLVCKLTNTLIVRTNVLGTESGSFVADSVATVRREQQLTLNASTFATPIDAESFGMALASCLNHGATGFFNIASAERTTPFHWTMSLAKEMNLSSEHIRPAVANGKASEQSMRCGRLRNECQLSPPLKSIVLEHLAIAFEERTSVNSIAA